jgi:hypothetical protein
MAEILGDCINIELTKQDLGVQRRAGRILRALGWTRRVIRDGLKKRRQWFSPEYRQEND